MGAIIIYAIIYFTTRDSSKYLDAKAKIELLQKSIDSLESQNKLLTFSKDSLTKETTKMVNDIFIYKQNLDSTKTELKNQQQKSHEKIIDVRQYNSNELDSFFSKRYS